MAARPNVSEERKQQILAAAQDVFGRHGFEKARMDDIAAAAGISKGTVYLYFPGKEALIHAMLEAFFEPPLAMLQALSVADGTALDRLCAVMDGFSEAFEEMFQSPVLSLEFYSLAARAAREEIIREYIKTHTAKSFTILAGLIEEGIAAGEFRRVDAMETAVVMSSVLEGLALIRAFDPDSVDWDRHSRAAKEILLHGLLP